MSEFYSRTPISLDELVQRAPSIAGGQHPRLTERYEHIPTIKVLEGLVDEGFNIYGFMEQGTRKSSNEGFQKHLVRMRTEEGLFAKEAPEILIQNAHNGWAAYNVFIGIIRFACTNGIIAGDIWAKHKVVHQGAGTADKVIDATYTVMEQFPILTDKIEQLKSVQLPIDIQQDFARFALKTKFNDPQYHIDHSIGTGQVLEARRKVDKGNDVWSVFNRVQENIIKGGIQYTKPAVGKRKFPRLARTRPVTAITDNKRINQALFDAAVDLAA